ncbi:hypothetical protein BC937DRAFT_94791, partial [Endogone sp. FLAS-F59071]
ANVFEEILHCLTDRANGAEVAVVDKDTVGLASRCHDKGDDLGGSLVTVVSLIAKVGEECQIGGAFGIDGRHDGFPKCIPGLEIQSLERFALVILVIDWGR